MKPVSKQLQIQLFVLALVVFSIDATAQKDTLITGSFSDASAQSFFYQIEDNTPYRFFFDSKQLDSICVNITATREPIDMVLKKAFLNTDILFSIDAENHV